MGFDPGPWDSLLARGIRSWPVGSDPVTVLHDVGMSAYWVATYRQILDEDKLAAYAALAGPALEAGGGRFIARGLPEQTYEHGEQARTVLIEFENVDAARAAHDSAAYQQALAALDGGAVRDIRIVPGT